MILLPHESFKLRFEECSHVLNIPLMQFIASCDVKYFALKILCVSLP
jgi:hypothetical protein